MIEFMAITNDPTAGDRWHEAGVDRIMVDLERHGKADRQRGRDTVQSEHSIDDARAIRRAVPQAHVVVRCEPLTLPDWGGHIQAVLDSQPQSIMVPMVESASEVARFTEAVDDRARRIIMIETAAALRDIEQLVQVDPEATYFVGLNDLHIQLGQKFMFEPLVSGAVERVAEAVAAVGASFGFGGLARAGRGAVDSKAIVREHVRLGSSLAILARSFFGDFDDPTDVDEVADAIAMLREEERAARHRDANQEIADRRSVESAIANVVAGISSGSS